MMRNLCWNCLQLWKQGEDVFKQHGCPICTGYEDYLAKIHEELKQQED